MGAIHKMLIQFSFSYFHPPEINTFVELPSIRQPLVENVHGNVSGNVFSKQSIHLFCTVSQVLFSFL